ncbi:hypothetical protein LABALGNA3A7_16460 [Dellaglioa algida]|nr:hypothetical protein LABALGNA3A7_16460 [Dellaglioa algida]
MNFNYQYIFESDDIDKDFSEFTCYFIFEGIEIFTQENNLIFKGQIELDGTNVTDTTTEITAKSRLKVIALLDVISFLIGTPITVYNMNTSNFSKVINEIVPLQKEHYFIYNNINIINDLDKILESLTKDRFLTASVLDKWNKANFLRKSDDSSVLYIDEAILNYLHIFELLSDTVKGDYKAKIDNEINRLLKIFFDRTSFDTDDKIKERIKGKKELTKEILEVKFLSFKDKLKYFLKSNGLLDEDTSFLVDNLIKLRNDIAHGRMIRNMDVMAYPLTPFYNTSAKEGDLVNPLRVLTAVSISKYIGINLWQNEWEEEKVLLQPSDTIIKKYLDNELLNFNINSENKFNINWYSLFRFYIAGNSKMKRKIEQKVESELKTIPFEELSALDMYELAIVLSTTQDEQLLSIIKKIIKNAIRQIESWSGNYKDIFNYLESRNYNTTEIQKVVKDIIKQI